MTGSGQCPDMTADTPPTRARDVRTLDAGPGLTSTDTVRTARRTVSGRRAEVSASIGAAFDLPPHLRRKDPSP